MTRICPHCQSDIAAAATRCPHCTGYIGKPPTSPVNTLAIFVVVLIGLVLSLILAQAIAACIRGG